MPNKRGSGGFGTPSNKNGKPSKKPSRCPKAIAEVQAVQLLGKLGEARRLIAQLERRNAPGDTSTCLSELATEGERERLVTYLKEAFAIPEPEAQQDLDEAVALLTLPSLKEWGFSLLQESLESTELNPDTFSDLFTLSELFSG